MQKETLQGFQFSPQQHRLWELLAGESGAAYRAQGVIRIAGPLDPRRLQGALREVVRRHEILRTTFRQLAGMTVPLQVIGEAGLAWENGCDLSGEGAEARPERLAALCREAWLCPWDLAEGPLFRARLVRLAEAEHALILTLPSLCADGTTLANLVREIADDYAAGLRGEEPAGEPLQYADFAQWQNELLQDEPGEVDAAGWRDLDLAPLLDRHLPGALPTGLTFEPRALRAELAPAVAARFREVARAAEVSREALLLACWSLLLGRSTGEWEVGVGALFGGRVYEELERALGLFAKHLPIAIRLRPEGTFLALAERIQKSLDDAFLRQESFAWEPFAAGGKGGAVSSLPFAFELVERETEHAAGGLRLWLEEQLACIERFELKLVGVLRRDGLAIELHYDAGLHTAPDMERLLARLLCVLDGALADPAAVVGELEVLGRDERRHLVVDFNRTAAALPADAALHRGCEQQAKRSPDAVAVVFDDEALTYAALDDRAERLARHLRRLQVGPEAIVGVCAERSLDLIVALLAVLKAGGAYLPLDPGYPRERLAWMLEDARPAVVLIQQRLAGALPESEAPRVLLDRELPEAAAAQAGPAATGGDAPAYVIYTSGSTGKPKGVVVAHRAITNRLLWMQRTFPLGASDRVLQKTPFSFDASIWELFSPLLAGACLVMARPGGHQDGAYLVDTVRDRQVTALQLVPSLLRVWLEEEGADRCATLRRVFCGGEALGTDVGARFAARLPGVDLINLYGPTEAAIDATFQECDAAHDGATVPIGRPLSNVRVYVLDERLRPVPAGVGGELCIGGAGLARGYLGRPELTAGRFIPDPLSGEPGARLYRTGDLARHLSRGALEFAGRLDHQVKVRGFRIEPGEIEAALRLHSGVREAVVAVPDDGGHPRLVAWVTVAGGQTPAAGELRTFLAAKLPEHMVPMAFVTVPALPRLPNGKVDRRALPVPAAAGDVREAAFTGPRTPAEERLAAIWSELLSLDRVGVHDNFFELGGDSILAIQIVARARQAGLQLTPRQLFQHQTIAALAAAAAAAPAKVEERTAAPADGPVPLTPIQHAFFEREPEAAHHYNQAVLLEIRRPFASALLRQAVAALLAHHDALRLRFEPAGREWRQIQAPPPTTVPFADVDLSALPAADVRRQACEAATSAIQESLDLARGPLLRVVRFAGGGTEQDLLLLVAHHLVVDGVSWRILLEDLETACGRLVRGEKVELPPRTSSFRDWAERLRQHARSEALRGELSYWHTLQAPGIAPLPVDGERSANRVAAARTLVVRLDGAETRALLQEVPKAYGTRIDDVLLAALVQAFAGWSDARSLLVDLEGHGREEIAADLDLSRTVGWFTCVYPVRLETADGEGPGEVLKAVKERLRSVPGKGLGHGVLRYCGGEEEAAFLGGLRKAEVSFNYLGQLDRVLTASSPFVPARESVGPTQSPQQMRPYLLDVTGSVADGRLQLGWSWGDGVHRRETVELLATRFLAALRELIAHCTSPGVGGYTPSDFPLAGLDQAGLDRLLGGERGIADVYPLSPVQEGLLFHALAGEPGVYVQQLTCTLGGPLDTAAFSAAWQGTVDRHPVLRTSFVWQGLDRPLQVVRSAVTLPIETGDWSAFDAAGQHARLGACLEEDRRRGFDLAQPPLLRVALFRLRDDLHRLVWTHHHLVLDGWSVPRVIREVFTAYEALRAGGGEVPRLDPGRPFRDFIEWLGQQDMAAAEAYWRDALAGVTEPTPLGIDQPAHGRAEGPETELLKGRLSVAASDGLRRVAQRHQVTLNTLVQGAWALLLARYGGRREVVFGTVSAGRPADLPGAESMLGVFINTLPMRVRVLPERALGSWLGELQEAQAELRQLDYAPLVDIQGWSQVPRGLPLFESLLVFENYPVDDSLRERATGLAVDDVRFGEQTHYPLTVAAAPGAALPFQIAYQTRRFDRAGAMRMIEHLRVLLEAMAAGPDAVLGELSPVSQAERHQLLVEANDTFRASAPACLHELFAGRAAAVPDAVAVAFEGGVLTYAELERRANRLARRLCALGAGPETIAAICLERSPEMLVGLLGILKAGGAYLPLDPELPAGRLELLVQDARPRVVVSLERFAPLLPAGVPVLCLDAEHAALAAQSASRLDAGTAPDGLAYTIYTSGSTGRPKGVMISHRAILNRLQWQARAFPLGAADRVLQKTPFVFDASVWELFLPLLAGCCTVLARPSAHRDPDAMAAAVAAHEVTVLQLVPSMLQLFADVPELERCRSLRLLFSGGEALPSALVERVSARLGAELINLYGPTETAIDASSWPGRLDAGSGTVPIGRPLDNLRIHLLAADLRPVLAGVAGRLHVGGPSLARGYLGRPDWTAQRFVPDPFSEAGSTPGARLYDTGDLARSRPDGAFEFLGRADHQVKVRGFRIEPEEIEAALARHEAVREAAVVVQEDGSGGKVLAAYLVAPGGTPAAAELRSFLAQGLPEFMVPSLFVQLAELPRTVSGKLDRKALREAGVAGDRGAAGASPRTPAEEMLASIWSEVLGLERIGVESDFFALGGHSLQAAQIISRVRETFRVELPISQLFETPTLDGLARVVEASLRAGALSGLPPLVPVPRDQPLPLSFAQQRLWFMDQLQPGNTTYNILTFLRLAGDLDVTAARRSLDEIVRRHESLRTTFTVLEGRPVQIVGPSFRLPLPLVDLRELPPSARELEVARLAAEAARRPFDLVRGPVVWACLVRLGEQDHAAFVILHHIAGDGWSMKVLVREFGALYAAFSSGRPSPLAEPPLQYADFAQWQRQWLAGEPLEAQFRYWRQQLAGTPPASRMPADRLPGERGGRRGGRRAWALSPDLSARLEALSRGQRVTLFMTLLASLNVLLSHHGGQSEVVVGTDVANRDHIGTEDLIGFFINQLVLRTDLSGNPTFAELLDRVRRIALAAYAHQQLPFERLVEELASGPDSRRVPLFHTKLVLQQAPPARLDLPGLSVSGLESEVSTEAEFDFLLNVTIAEGVLAGSAQYDADLFEAATVAHFLDQLEQILESAAANPGIRLDELGERLRDGELRRQEVRSDDLKQLNLQKMKSALRKAVVAAPTRGSGEGEAART